MNSRLYWRRRIYSGSQAGVTLVEMMVSVVVLTVGILGLIATFGSIQKSMQLSKNKTLASNLAQEKLHILMQKPYHQVIPTPNPSGEDTDYDPSIPYDTSYFPVEYILQGGVTYKRMTYIQTVRENSGTLQLLAPETPDTGMRLLTVSIAWSEGGNKKRLELSSVMSNPDSVMSNSALTGTVTIFGTATPIQGALVVVAENVGWRDSTNASGSYSISLSPGAATLMATANGYHPKYVDVVAVANASVTENIVLVPIASGTVRGTAWTNPGLLISQVVASSAQANGFIAQYVELFNPTTVAVTIGGDPPPVKLNFRTNCTGSVTCMDAAYGIKLDYVNNSIEAGGYYLIANTNTFTINGTTVAADAVYSNSAHTFCSVMPGGAVWNAPSIKQLITINHGGAVWLTDAGGAVIDAVGSVHNGVLPVVYEGTYLNLGAVGMIDGMQVIRVSSPSFLSPDYGRAYDSGSNTVDFTTMTITYDVFTTTHSPIAVVAGVPAVGAVVSADDGLSNPTTAYATGSPPTAVFTLPHVATGTWTVLITSGTRLLRQDDSVTIAATGSSYVFPSSTTMLDEEAVNGFISGTVVDVNGAPLSGITVSAGAAGLDQTTNASGRYFLAVSTGSVDVTANPDSANASYVSMSSSNISVELGAISNGVNFALSQGGRFSGFVSRDGVNALPGIAVLANDSNEISRDIQVSDSNGRFTTINIATGTYELTPAVDSLETSSPTSITATVTTGQTVFVGTFTITGALGTISGTVTAGGVPIATGVLIVVTTKTLTGTPPAPPSLSTSSLTDAAYYIASSLEDGTYHVDVRQSTNPVYNIYGYYYATNGTGADATTSKTATAGVLAGQTTGQHNLAW